MVMIKFDVYFMTKKNITCEKTRVHLRAHRAENVSQFVRALYGLADSCNLANRNEEIKKIFHIRLQDKGFSKRLQFTLNLILDKTSEMTSQNRNGGKAEK